jgi:hypothetical protein
MSNSPVADRGAATESPVLVIPAGVDIVDLQMEGAPGDQVLARARVAIRTVNGDEVWAGAAASAPDLPAGVIARAAIPAARLNADDYIVTLWALDPAGAASERHRYFLRVR